MISVLVCSSPAASHMTPMLGVAQALTLRGWRVRFLAGTRFAEAVAATGSEHIPLPPEADVLDQLDLSDRPRGIRAMNDGIDQAFLRPAPSQFRAISQALENESADAVIADPSFLGVALLRSLPATERPIVVKCGIFPLGLVSRDTAPFGLGIGPRSGALGRARNAVLYWLARRILLARVHRQFDTFLTDGGLEGLNGRFFTDVIFTGGVDLYAQLTVPAFEYPRSDLPSCVRFFGPVRRSPSDTGSLPDWWGDLDGSRPVVLVTQGTVGNTDYGELVEPTLAALADEPVLVVVAWGAVDGRKAGDFPALPSNARAATFLPYALLMPKLAAFVTNGGYGGLHDAMAHGLPIVVAGDTEDKLENAARVQWAGVGINLRTGRPQPARIRTAVRTVLTENRYREASERIGAAIADSPGVNGLAEELQMLITDRRTRAA